MVLAAPRRLQGGGGGGSDGAQARLNPPKLPLLLLGRRPETLQEEPDLGPDLHVSAGPDEAGPL